MLKMEHLQFILDEDSVFEANKKEAWIRMYHLLTNLHQRVEKISLKTLFLKQQ